MKIKNILMITGLIFLTQNALATQDDNDDDSMTRCLKSWGTHPFAAKPKYKTLSTSVKVFGIGKNLKDSDVTADPALVLINPGVNVMGGMIYELLNPRGWYCFRSNVNVMGGLVIKTHCKARLAFASNGTTVLASNESESNGVTVMGSTRIERVKCD